MFVYVFRLNPELNYGEEQDRFFNFLLELRKKGESQFNYLPSKKVIVLGLEKSVYDDIYTWIINNMTHDIEFEEHGSEFRTLTQFSKNKMVVHYLLPLFEPESYLTL